MLDYRSIHIKNGAPYMKVIVYDPSIMSGKHVPFVVVSHFTGLVCHTSPLILLLYPTRLF